MQWARLEMYNAVCELLCYMTITSKLDYNTIKNIMKYCATKIGDHFLSLQGTGVEKIWIFD